MTKRNLLLIIVFALTFIDINAQIDRHALLERNNPVVTRFDSLQSLTVGNGDFAFTVDATGLQTFPEIYSKGVPLGTMSSWGWHYAENEKNYSFDDVLEEYDFGHGHKEIYAGQKKSKEASDYFRENPHRLHLGCVGFYGLKTSSISNIKQTLHLETGEIVSTYNINGKPVEVKTVCSQNSSTIAVHVKSDGTAPLPLTVRMPYPTQGHSDDACDWTRGADFHQTIINECNSHSVQLTHHFPIVKYATEFGTQKEHDASYHLGICASCDISVKRLNANQIVITPSSTEAEYIFDWQENTDVSSTLESYGTIYNDSYDSWHDYWYKGGVVDFSHCTDPQARELERRVVLSQYLLAVNSGGATPPQETGLTYNSWFGKFHLEMIWWHQAQFALWGHAEKLHRTLSWYNSAEVVETARLIAKRQGFKGLRWMKMTDKSGLEAPSKVGSFLIWQQPHLIHLAELLRRSTKNANAKRKIVKEFAPLVEETAEFMVDFTTYDKARKRYTLQGYIPAQETLKASEVMNSPYELSQWHLTLQLANAWRVANFKKTSSLYSKIVKDLSALSSTDDITDSAPSDWNQLPLYLAAETAADTYKDIRFTQDHMAVLGALGIYPTWSGINEQTMLNTLLWVQQNWNWDKTWGWDHPMTAMCAVRLHRPDLAIKSLLAPHRTNTYLVSGHNYQDTRLRIYLPGNGALLQCVALMCAGWDGCNTKNPGFPSDWDVRWEGILPMP